MPTADAQPRRRWTIYLPALVLATFALWLRVDSTLDFADRHLWAEDGTQFIPDAVNLGFSSLFQPFSGYLHLYPRIVSLAASCLPLEARPFAMLIGWYLAYLALALACARLLKNLGASSLLVVLAPVLVSLQPNAGEVFFNITNAQWLLGAALFLFAFTPAAAKPGYPLLFALCIAGLTGPFSIILAGLSILFLLPFNSAWRHGRSAQLVLFVCAIVQFLVFVGSNRASHRPSTFDPVEWLTGIWRVSSLGADDAISALLALGIICSLTWSFIVAPRGTPHRLVASALLATALVMALAAMYLSHSPLVATPLGNGHRYTWIPYSMILMAASLLIGLRNAGLQSLFVVSTVTVFVTNHSTPFPANLHFASFARLSEVTETVIPIHPVLPNYPGWAIQVPPLPAKTPGNPQLPDLQSAVVESRGMRTTPVGTALDFINMEADASLSLDTGVNCRRARHVGVEIDMHRTGEGPIVLFWSDNRAFDEKYAFRRWYPSGSTRAQFAFPGYPGRIHLRLHPQQATGSGTIRSVRIHCLD